MTIRKMPAITLHQPYASLIVGGTKLYETRIWAPRKKYIGERIAIHAGKARTRAQLDDIEIKYGFRKALPFGAVLGEATLENAAEIIGKDDGYGGVAVEWLVKGSDPFIPIGDTGHGDFSIGRWAWKLVDVEAYQPPVPARGRQGFWMWEAS